MQIILLEDIPALGYKDEVVKVKEGYAQNFLIPRKKAVIATPSSIRALTEKKKQQQLKFERMMKELNLVADKMKKSPVKIAAKAGTTGKIFGSVTPIQVAEALNKSFQTSIDRRKIRLLDEIKTIGSYRAEVELHRDFKVEVQFEVVAD